MNITDLPNEIILNITKYLDDVSISQIQLCCMNIYNTTLYEVAKRKSFWKSSRDATINVFMKIFFQTKNEDGVSNLFEIMDEIFKLLTPYYKKLLFDEENKIIFEFFEKELKFLFFAKWDEKAGERYISIFGNPILKEKDGWLVSDDGYIYYHFNCHRVLEKYKSFNKFNNDNPNIYVPNIFLCGKYTQGRVENLSRIEYYLKKEYDYAWICPSCKYLTNSIWTEKEECLHCGEIIDYMILGSPVYRYCEYCEEDLSILDEEEVCNNCGMRD